MSTGRAHLTSVETVHECGSWLFTVRDAHGVADEVVLVPCEDGVEAWINRCPHEAQRFDTGRGAPIRDGEIVCPKHGSLFDACNGDCDNGEAAGTRLVTVEVAVDLGEVYLDDDAVTFEYAGGIQDGPGVNGADGAAGGDGGSDDEDVPDSTSHIGF